MFSCQIELSVPVEEGENPMFYTVGKHQFDPGFKEGDTLQITSWRVWGEEYTFNALVLNRKYEIHPPDKKLNKEFNFPEIATKEGLIILRIFVEAEDRDKVSKLHKAIKDNN